MKRNHAQPEFLPISGREAEVLGIDQFDIILVSGDAYLDHPACASALLGRTLWDAGFTVGIIPQPDIRDRSSFEILGTPRLFFSIGGGAMDPMVAHYTPALKKRSADACSPGGRLIRPDRATLVYTDLVHRTFPKTPVIIGGVEASLRRFAHYDYWSDRVRQSILADAPADLLVFGMGEKQLITLATRADKGEDIATIRDVQGTCWKIAPKEWVRNPDPPSPVLEIPSFSEVAENSASFAYAHTLIAGEQDPWYGQSILQKHPKTYIVQNPPAIPLTTGEIDHIYELPYRREAHPSYRDPVPALEPVRYSITSHRGCYGNCSFCALAMHQGSIIQSRSPESILQEVELIASMPGFTGTISDIGGPSVNMYGDRCSGWERESACKDRACISCPAKKSGITRYLDLLDAAAAIPGVKHVFIGSGLRYDLLPDEEAIMKRICAHVSGQLKVAPEHIASEVTRLMNKPGIEVFERFVTLFREVQKIRTGKQYLIPYLMSGHPGCTISDMITLAEFLRDTHLYTEQVQDFTPTPMTASSCMYATGIDPGTMQPVHVPKGEEKRIQRAMLHWRDPAGYNLVKEGLISAGRKDLIGEGPGCLISNRKPVVRPPASGNESPGKKGKRKS